MECRRSKVCTTISSLKSLIRPSMALLKFLLIITIKVTPIRIKKLKRTIKLWEIKKKKLKRMIRKKEMKKLKMEINPNQNLRRKR